MDKLIKYFKDVVAELKKVVWPTKEALMSSTIIVIIVSLIFSLYILVVDKLLNQVIGLILKN